MGPWNDPFPDVIDVLTRRKADLAATTAMWQTWATYLENQLKQLTAGDAVTEEDEPETSPEAVKSPQTSETEPQGFWSG